MADVFVSYARPDEPQAQRLAEALRTHGYGVWRDDELPAHLAYADVIQERLKSAKAVVVLWSAEAAKSQWVRSEADAARQLGTLVQATIDGLRPPMPFDQIQCADLSGWSGNSDAPGWRKLVGSLAALAGCVQAEVAKKGQTHKHRVSICVLPFANMSGDAEQEYFSDGISEDITTDLSKVSALAVTARNIAFMFKGTAVDVIDVARRLAVSHVLEGSVRKAGNRVRITAQLIDGGTGDHVWADRYDRDLTDIFQIQDEISKAIVDALKVKLLPDEKKAIGSRGTENVDAYNLYLMARQQWISGTFGNARRERTIIGLCKEAVELDPDYAQAWALMALAQAELSYWHGIEEDPLPAADRALLLNHGLPEAMCVKARYLEREGRAEEATREIEAALRLGPDSWEVNREAGRLLFREHRVREAVPFLEHAMKLMDSDFHSGDLLLDCYASIGDQESVRRVADLTLPRCEAALSQDPTNGAALAAGVAALLAVGESKRGRQWVQRALALDPDNAAVLYNLACPLTRHGTDLDLALELFERHFERVNSTIHLKHIDADPDLDSIRDHPRFRKMLAAAKKRLRVSG